MTSRRKEINEKKKSMTSRSQHLRAHSPSQAVAITFSLLICVENLSPTRDPELGNLGPA